MFLRRIRFDISDGVLVTALDQGLREEWADGLTVDVERPTPATRRMVMLRNDSGPSDLVQQYRRYGCSVHAETRVLAEKLALDSIDVLQTVHAAPVSWTDSFTGPRWIEPTTDDPAIAVGDALLSEFYFTFRAGVRGKKPEPSA